MLQKLRWHPLQPVLEVRSLRRGACADRSSQGHAGKARNPKPFPASETETDMTAIGPKLCLYPLLQVSGPGCRMLHMGPIIYLHLHKC